MPTKDELEAQVDELEAEVERLTAELENMKSEQDKAAQTSEGRTFSVNSVRGRLEREQADANAAAGTTSEDHELAMDDLNDGTATDDDLDAKKRAENAADESDSESGRFVNLKEPGTL